MGVLSITGLYVGACVVVSALAQFERLVPVAIAFPASARDATQEPWRLVSAFCYSDGLTVGSALRLHVAACASHAMERACALRPASRSERSPIPLAGAALHAACLLLGFALLAAASLLRPSELGAPFQLGSVAVFLSYVACRLPEPTRLAIGGVPGLPVAPWVPYAIVGGCAAAYGGEAALRLFGALGAGVLFECLDVLPTPRPPLKPQTPPAAAAGDAPPAVADEDAAATTGAAAPRPPSKLTWATLVLLALSWASAALEWERPPPILPAARLMRQHGRALYAATALAPSPPPEVAAYLGALHDATNLSSAVKLPAAAPTAAEAAAAAAHVAAVRAADSSRPLNAAQLLKLYQHVADAWHAKLRDIRQPPSQGNLRAKGGKGGRADLPELTEAEAAEMERLLSDALSRADFAASTTDRDVLKTLLKGLTPTQVRAQRARRPPPTQRAPRKRGERARERARRLGEGRR